MVWIIILAVLAALILLIFFVPYGVDASYENGVFRLGVKAGPIRIGLLPKKPLTEKQRARKEKKQAKKDAKRQAKEEKKAQEAQQEKLDETEKIRKKPDLDFETVMALLKMGAHAIRRFFRSFTVDLLRIHYTVATPDPYNTAMLYGGACAAVEALPAMCGDVIRIRRRDIRIGSDFLSEESEFSGRITLTLQLFRLVHMAVAFGVEFLKWKIKHRGAKSADANERKDDNGREQDQ